MQFKLRRDRLKILFVIGVIASFVFLAVSAQQQSTEMLSKQESCQNQLGKSFARTELVFGLSKANQSVITETEFQRFIDREVTPLFPDGLTVFSATGQFKNSNKAIVKEQTKILLLLYSANNESYTSIEQIRNAYKSMFQQESVLRVDDRSCVSF